MSDASVTGIDGCVMRMQLTHGLLLSSHLSLDQRFDELQQMQARDDDVIMCGYPKCGTNWAWEVVMMLLNNSTEYMKTSKAGQMLEMNRVPMSAITDVPSPRVLNTHLPFSHLPPDSIKKRSKLIYLVRNDKDVAVSYYNHKINTKFDEYEGSWNAYIELFAKGLCEFGSYFKYLKQWEQDIRDHPEIPVITVAYEDLKQDFLTEVRRLCKFLGVSRDDKFLESVQDACSFKKLKDAKDSGMKQSFKEGKSIFRKGGVGDWKNWFTVAQSEMLDKVFEEEMKGVDMKFKYVL